MGYRYPKRSQLKYTKQRYRIRNWPEYEAGYTKRCLVETAMSRYKAIIGSSMRSRAMASQKVEATLACVVINRMMQLGMPDGYCIA